MTFPYLGRREDARLLTGAGRYSSDWSLPGQAHAVFLRADRAHADIRSIDLSAARGAPGVVAVLTGEDAAAAGFDRNNTMMPVKGIGGQSMVELKRPALAVGRVRYVGEPVALVVAETQAQAQDAAELVAIEFEDRAVIATVVRAVTPGAALLHEKAAGNLCFDYAYGDEAETDAAFARAATVVRLDLRSDRVVGNPMEPKAALAVWRDGMLDIWTSTQGMIAFRDSLVMMTGLDPATIRVRAQEVGGGFGIRGPAYPEHAALVLAARQTGRPVKWVASRSETFLSDYHGRGLVMHGELALDAEGRFLALRHEWLCDQGAFPSAAGPFINALNGPAMCTGCYRIPAVYGHTRLALTNTVPITAYRGAGRPDMAYIVERLVDEAARETGRDRLALRRLNAVPADAFPYKLPSGTEYDSGDYTALLDRAVAVSDWDGFAARRTEAAARGHLRGIGCALFVEPAGGVVPKDEVQLSVDDEGFFVLHNVTQSNGQGHETVYPEIIARVLEIDPSRIFVRQSDPDGPALVGGGAFGSRSTMSVGGASDIAARAMVKKGMALAAEALEAAEADLEYGGGDYRIAGTDRAISLATLAERHRGALDTKSELLAPRSFPSGAHVAEVEIDPATGVVAMVRYTAVDDCGRVMNPTLLEGQILGGMLQGLGQVLGEICRYDADGQMLTGSFMDYAMPHSDMLTSVSLEDLSVPSPSNPLGVKGAGEAGTTGALPAAMNAILDALGPRGVRHLDMPATAQAVWRALQQASV